MAREHLLAQLLGLPRRARARAAALGVLAWASACAPSLADLEGFPCANDQTCPGDFACRDGRCMRSDVAATDSGSGGNDAPDAGTLGISVSISPPIATVAGTTTTTFSAAVAGTSDQNVTWSVTEVDGGTITPTGVYTAPAKAGKFHVVATSAADRARSAIATVSVWYGTFTKTTTSLISQRGLFAPFARTVSLPDGRVVFAGGSTGTAAVRSVDIVSMGAVSSANTMSAGRVQPGIIASGDGMLAIGGHSGGTTPTGIASIDRFSATTDKWTVLTSSLNVARSNSAVVRTADNRVFVIGGQVSASSHSTLIEVIDPGNWSVTKVGGMLSARSAPMALPLDDGRILIAGGAVGTVLQTATDLFTPKSGSNVVGPVMSNAHSGGNLARLPSGAYLFAGGCADTTCAAAIATCDTYTPAFGQLGAFKAVAPMNQASGGHAMLALPTGRILVAGGADASGAHKRAEVYDPTTNTWTTVGAMSEARYDAAIALAGDGKAVIGGGRSSESTWLSSVEIFDPGVPTLCKVCQVDGSCLTLTDGTACDDGDSKTSGETCKHGSCHP